MKAKHDKEKKQFSITTDGKEQTLSYNSINEKLWAFIQAEDTDVDCCGVIEELIESALQHIKENEIKILANCCSIQNYILKNKEEYKDIIYHPD